MESICVLFFFFWKAFTPSKKQDTFGIFEINKALFSWSWVYLSFWAGFHVTFSFKRTEKQHTLVKIKFPQIKFNRFCFVFPAILHTHPPIITKPLNIRWAGWTDLITNMMMPFRRYLVIWATRNRAKINSCSWLLVVMWTTRNRDSTSHFNVGGPGGLLNKVKWVGGSWIWTKTNLKLWWLLLMLAHLFSSKWKWVSHLWWN